VFRNPLARALVGRFEHLCINAASALQVLSPGFMPALRSRVRDARKPVVVIPPWVDTSRYAPRARLNGFSRRHALDDRFVVLYAGNIGLSQDLGTVVLAAQRVAEHTAIRFVLVGDGAAKSELVRRAEALKLSNLLFLPVQPAESVPEMLASADIALVPIGREVGEGSLPSKIFPLLACGCAILASAEPGGTVWSLLTSAGAGLCIAPADPAGLSSAVLALFSEPETRRKMGVQARALAEREFSRARALRDFVALFETLGRGAMRGRPRAVPVGRVGQ
jgi:colanic acid biosynthesis glycosyl transferase WcaI